MLSIYAQARCIQGSSPCLCLLLGQQHGIHTSSPPSDMHGPTATMRTSTVHSCEADKSALRHLQSLSGQRPDSAFYGTWPEQLPVPHHIPVSASVPERMVSHTRPHGTPTREHQVQNTWTQTQSLPTPSTLSPQPGSGVCQHAFAAVAASAWGTRAAGAQPAWPRPASEQSGINALPRSSACGKV